MKIILLTLIALAFLTQPAQAQFSIANPAHPLGITNPISPLNPNNIYRQQDRAAERARERVLCQDICDQVRNGQSLDSGTALLYREQCPAGCFDHGDYYSHD